MTYKTLTSAFVLSLMMAGPAAVAMDDSLDTTKPTVITTTQAQSLDSERIEAPIGSSPKDFWRQVRKVLGLQDTDPLFISVSAPLPGASKEQIPLEANVEESTKNLEESIRIVSALPGGEDIKQYLEDGNAEALKETLKSLAQTLPLENGEKPVDQATQGAFLNLLSYLWPTPEQTPGEEPKSTGWSSWFSSWWATPAQAPVEGAPTPTAPTTAGVDNQDSTKPTEGADPAKPEGNTDGQ